MSYRSIVNPTKVVLWIVFTSLVPNKEEFVVVIDEDSIANFASVVDRSSKKSNEPFAGGSVVPTLFKSNPNKTQ